MARTKLPAAKVTVTREDATVEQICFEYAWQVLGDRHRAGQLPGYVEAAIEANRGMAALGLVLPLGTAIALPEWVADDTRPAVRLWD